MTRIPGNGNVAKADSVCLRNLYLCEYFNAQYVRSILKFNMWLEKIIISIFYLICF